MAAAPLRVFISHIHEEAALGAVVSSCIKDAFHARSVTTFLSGDAQDLPAGRKWIEVIEQELDQAAVVVALLSPASLRRPWVNIELGAAWIKHRHIIPLCHSDLRVGDLPRPFGDFHGVGLDQDDAAERLIGGVADGLRLEQPRRLAFKQMLAELRSAAAGIKIAESPAPDARAEPPDLPPEQIRMLRFLAGLANRGIDKVPLSNLAAGTQVGLAAMKYHLAELEKRHFVYVGHHPKPRESDVRISPGGVGWLLAQDEMPGSS